MANFVEYNSSGLYVLDVDPVGTAGLILNDNIKEIADRLSAFSDPPVSGDLSDSSNLMKLSGVNSGMLDVEGIDVEHLLINSSAGNNTLRIQNSDIGGYSALRITDYQGHDQFALGYGNPTGFPSNDCFMEISKIPFSYASAPGFSILHTTDFGGTWSGVGQAYNQWRRMRVKKSGLIDFYEPGGCSNISDDSGYVIRLFTSQNTGLYLRNSGGMFGGGIEDSTDYTGEYGVRVGVNQQDEENIYGYISSVFPGAGYVPLKIFATSLTLSGNVFITDAKNIILGTGTGTKIGTATGQKLAFHNSTPVIQRANSAQTAVVTTAATQTTPYGFATQAQADAIVALVNELRAAFVEKGLIKGSA